MNRFRTPNRALAWGLPLLLTGMVAATYGRVAGYPFVDMDDQFYVFGNFAVSEGLTFDGIRWAFTTVYAANWHPLTWLSHMLDVSLFGMNAGRHHLVNVLFHLLNSLFLFGVLRKMTGRTWESGMVAALFAVHPLHVESVAWISERKDVLSAFFFLLSLWAYARYCERPGALRYAAVLLAFALGLLAKPMLVTLPFVLLLLDHWPLGRLVHSRAPSADPGPPRTPIGLSRAFLEKIPLLLLSALSCAITLRAQAGTVATLDYLPLWARSENALLSYAGYLWKAVWPSGLAVFHPFPRLAHLHPKAAGAGLFLLGVTAAAAWQVRRRPYLAVGWFWYLGMLLPVIGLVQVGMQAMADRYTYLPLIGPFLAVVRGFGELAGRWRIPKAAVALAAGGWLAALSVCAWIQVGTWKDSVSLFRHALRVTGDNWMAHESLGLDSLRAGRTEEALAHFREVVRIAPGYSERQYAVYRSLSRPEKIEADANDLLAEKRKAMAHDSDVLNWAGLNLAGKGRIELAAHFFRQAVRIHPDAAESHYNLAVALGRLGKKEEAIPHFREALRIPPVDAEACNKIGVALVRLGRFEEAADRFREALRLRPDSAEARFNLAVSLERSGRREEAIALYREILRRSPGDRDAGDSLERLLGEKGPAPGGGGAAAPSVPGRSSPASSCPPGSA